ncbi:hypothetical protein DEO72_LG7g2404 [Vigna unguiculata]|uniref:Uncharacterized protein n=1 Tax=Vigna unguiculata TaxID=3917 RepID=A0A4D6MKA5_VIGUN|nr:hypothetical protein DEO72_LG7g2404 [Vigna unguiculata]
MLAILVSIAPFRFFPLGLPSNPYRALVSLSFQFFHSLLELLCSCVRCRGSVGSFASLFQARGVLPKRGPACASAPCFEPSPRRRGLAWARTSRLSETLQPERGAGRDSAMRDCFLGFV